MVFININSGQMSRLDKRSQYDRSPPIGLLSSEKAQTDLALLFRLWRDVPSILQEPDG